MIGRITGTRPGRYVQFGARLLFCDNETNTERLFSIGANVGERFDERSHSLGHRLLISLEFLGAGFVLGGLFRADACG